MTVSDRTELSTVIAILAGLRRCVQDAAPGSESSSSGSDAVLRALAQAAGSYFLVDLLEGIEEPIVRTAVAAGFASLGHVVADASGADRTRLLLGDTLRFAGASVALLGAVEVASGAIESLRRVEAPFGNRPRVFVSHSWVESEDFFNLKTRLDAQLSYLDHSVHVGKQFTERSDEELDAKLRLQMRGIHVLLVLAHDRALRSHWVKREIEIASLFRKPIIAVRPHGERRRPLHPLLRAAAVEQVGWDAPAIARRIRDWTDFVRLASDRD